jgi:hypothetical protein
VGVGVVVVVVVVVGVVVVVVGGGGLGCAAEGGAPPLRARGEPVLAHDPCEDVAAWRHPRRVDDRLVEHECVEGAWSGELGEHERRA